MVLNTNASLLTSTQQTHLFIICARNETLPKSKNSNMTISKSTDHAPSITLTQSINLRFILLRKLKNKKDSHTQASVDAMFKRGGPFWPVAFLWYSISCSIWARTQPKISVKNRFCEITRSYPSTSKQGKSFSLGPHRECHSAS